MAAPVRRWYVAYFGVQKFAKILKESSEKKENGGISQADQRENHRFFRSLSLSSRSKKATTP